MDLSRLFHPRSIAVVGATDHGDAYGSQTLLNLAAVRFPGHVWGVNLGRAQAHGIPCVPSLADLPGVPDAVVVAIPAAGVPAVIEEAGSLGCGGAVVYAAGFGEGGNAELEEQLRDAALRHAFPVCGPNCDGLIALHTRAALWGDALVPREPGHVALVSQSGNLAVNALATRRGLRLHTAISSGNETVLTTPDYVEHLSAEPDVRSVAPLIEDDGDGARLCDAALALDVAAEPEVRAAYRAVASRNGAGAVLVERMLPPGAELIVAVRRDAVVPALVIGLGGVYAESLDDVAVVPLPATPARIEAALATLKGADLLTSADLPSAAHLAAALATIPGLELIECNPVLVHEHGAVVVDAIAKETA